MKVRIKTEEEPDQEFFVDLSICPRHDELIVMNTIKHGFVEYRVDLVIHRINECPTINVHINK